MTAETVRLEGGFGVVHRGDAIPPGEITRTTPRTADDYEAEIDALRREIAVLRERLAGCCETRS